MTDLAPVLLAFAHVILGVLVLIAAKLVKDRVSPYRVDQELTAKDNPAFGLAVAGYYAGAAAVYVGSARPGGLPLDAGTRGALLALGVDLLWALGGVLALNASRWLMDRLLVTGTRNAREIVDNRNLAAGAVEAGVYVASGLVLAGAIREPGGTIWTAVAFYLLSQFALIVLGRIYQRWAGYEVAREIGAGNLASGTAFALTLVALALLMLKATSGEFVDWPTNLGYFAVDAVGGFLLLMLLRWVTDAALLPGARISEEIVRDRNVNVGLVEGVLAIGIAAVILFVF
jgi:uncharacterized membrane protein YjfL (UPF0719 family)